MVENSHKSRNVYFEVTFPFSLPSSLLNLLIIWRWQLMSMFAGQLLQTVFHLSILLGFALPSVKNLGAISLEWIHATIRPFKHRLIKKKNMFGTAVATVWITTGLYSGINVFKLASSFSFTREFTIRKNLDDDAARSWSRRLLNTSYKMNLRN